MFFVRHAGMQSHILTLTHACLQAHTFTYRDTCAYSFSKTKYFCSRIGREGEREGGREGGREGERVEEDKEARWEWGQGRSWSGGRAESRTYYGVK